MCQISVVNLNDAELNKKMFLIMGTLGSTVHKDGWGVGNVSGDHWKCQFPMFLTSGAGEALRKFVNDAGTPLLGHIRQASAKVPVVTKNAHPFFGDEIVFVHNGKLTPKEEDNFIMEEEVLDINSATGKPYQSKDGKDLTKKVAISDSLIFFREFLKKWAEGYKEGDDLDKAFVTILNETMNLFHGKFAFVFIIRGNIYVVRGKSADLHLVSVHDEAEKEMGIVINTSKLTLLDSLTFMNNLLEIDGRPPLFYDAPVLLEQETAFKVTGNTLTVLGKVTENYAPVATTHAYNNRGAQNFTPGGTTTATTTATGATKPTKHQEEFGKIAQFMSAYSLSIGDIQNLFFVLYGASLLELNEAMLKHFLNKVLPALASKTSKDIRKALKKALGGIPFNTYRYKDDMKYPWMLNDKKKQESIVKELSMARIIETR